MAAVGRARETGGRLPDDRRGWARLLERTAEAGGTCETLEEAAQVVVDEICALTGWPAGHLYRRGDSGALEPTSVWHLDDPDRFEELRRATWAAGAPTDGQLPEKIVAAKRPGWAADIGDATEPGRASAAAAAGLRAWCGLPVIAGDQVYAVLEFFTSEPAEPDTALLDVLAGVGAQLTRVLERERGADALRRSEERYEALAQSFERQLADRALRDHLTGLPNRSLLLDRLEVALARAGRERSSVAVLVVDLDRFKAVNDSLGYQVGDELLRAVASRLQRLVRPGDTVARMSSDEFAVLLEDLADRQNAWDLARHVITAFDQEFELSAGPLSVSASAGLTVAPGGASAPGLLLSEADTALHRARQRRAGPEMFDEEMRTDASRRYGTEQDLRRAIGANQLVLHYQPIITLGTGTLFGAEALVRWQHPVRGLLQPSEFVPVAEETGLIVPLGRWVLAEACRQAVKWQTQTPGAPGFTLAVNVSTHEFQQADWLEHVARVLADAGLPAERLVIEITESAFMEDTEMAAVRLKELQTRVGVRLAIDDFGTGYSSLAYLRDLPVDILKIDKSFIEGITEGPHESALARAVLRLARTLQLEAVAEGIEREEQLVMLQRLGCQLGQGFHLGRPVPGEVITQLLGG